MVIDPASLFEELETLEKQNISWKGRLFISDRAHLVLPRYKIQDKNMEKERRNPIGTTGRGIGVTYAHKAHREGVRVADLFDADAWSTLPMEDKTFLEPFLERIKLMKIDLVSFQQEHRGEKILFEGAQGALLDLDIGTYPYVSSGYSAAAGASLGGGVGPLDLDRVLGVFKALYHKGWERSLSY
jgi:adenylosuccinate synthase